MSENKQVPAKSGLNQWNASGRPRSYREVYIPIPTKANEKFPSFFPNRETFFQLKLPNGTVLNSKVCQENNKALMSNPNTDLGEWVLEEVLGIPYGEVATYNHLITAGIDFVEVEKINNVLYKLNFLPLNSYQLFKNTLD